VARKLHAYRNDGNALRLEIAFQQWMPRVEQKKGGTGALARDLFTSVIPSEGVSPSRGTLRLLFPNKELRLHAVVFIRKTRFRKLQFQLAENVCRMGNVTCALAQLASHLQQNPVHLFQFVFQKAYEFVVLFN